MKIWFNQSFSLRTVIANMVAARPGLPIAVSAIDGNAPVRDVAPEFWVEPARGATDYVAWVLATAIERGVTDLVAGRGRSGIAAQADRFAAAGITLHLAADAATLDLLDDKAAFTASLGDDPHRCPSIVATSAKAFVDAVATLTQGGRAACVKPVRGVYGAGYWTLDGATPLAHLADPDARRIAPALYADALVRAEAAGEAFALLVMEHLPGLEASVDIVADRGAVLLAAVRTKLDANRQRIQTRHPLIAHAAMLTARHRLHGALNVQYKQDADGEWRILEINSRAAGGASYGDAVGIPFCATWIDLVTGSARAFTGVVDAEVVAVVHATPRAQQKSGTPSNPLR